MGVDVGKLLERAEAMVWSCMPSVPLAENPGVLLGTIIGVAARDFRRDKLTIVASPQVAVFGAWLEQLVAESTGKDGRGVIPVDREKLTTPELYGPDRIFAYLRLAAAPDHEQDRLVGELERAGHPVVRISLDDVYDLGAEFFRWEVATAVAGALLGVHPFDQPDVEASKTATRKLTAAYEQTGTFPAEEPIWREEGIELYTDGRNAAELSSAMRRAPTLAGYLRAHFDRLEAGDYCALLAYLEMSDVHERALQTVRERVRDGKRVATCLEFGPRFLHSTGQAYKGGPNTGVFLQITCEDAADVPVPGRAYTFGVVKAMQARGDLEVLFARRRRALRIHLTRDIEAALAKLDAAVATALRQ
jgi:transaldolase/glucose-6-phosphate isomerase